MNSLQIFFLILLLTLTQTLSLYSQTTLVGWDFEDQDLIADVATDGSGSLPYNSDKLSEDTEHSHRS